MAVSLSSSLSLSNFLTSLLSPATPSPPPPSPVSLVSLPNTASPSLALLSPRSPPGRITEVVSVPRSDLMWFKSAYNVQVIAEENEPEEKLLSRFRREVFRAGVLQECRRRRFFEDSHDRRKRKVREAARRNRRRRPQVKVSTKAEPESPRKKVDEEDDNWDDFDVNIPY